MRARAYSLDDSCNRLCSNSLIVLCLLPNNKDGIVVCFIDQVRSIDQVRFRVAKILITTWKGTYHLLVHCHLEVPESSLNLMVLLYSFF